MTGHTFDVEEKKWKHFIDDNTRGIDVLQLCENFECYFAETIKN
jgi:hypothetical protein